MERDCTSSESNAKYLLDQLITARKEIHNLRQQIKSLRYVHEKDVNSIKSLLKSQCTGPECFPGESATFDPGSACVKINESSTNSSLKDTLTLRPIGTISTWFSNKKGTPRQPVVCGKVPGKLTISKNVLTNPEHALQGLEEFSHMWILFYFHKNEPGHVRAKVAPPRLNGSRTGVFSTRSPHRPSPIGLSLVKIIKIEDNIIYFQGVDMVDETPVLDIKPYIPHYDNPIHVEKMSSPVYLEELEENISSTLADSSINYVDMFSKNSTCDEEPTNSISNLYNYHQASVDSRVNGTIHQYHNNAPSSSSSAVASSIDLSRDEELALRIQAVEFQDDIDELENNYSYNHHLRQENQYAAIISSRSRTDSIDYDISNTEVNINDNQNPRTSRLLDGADGPNAVCGTDLDLINRRALNLRLDDSSSSSSPIRMGVREAPDGEEGFDLPQSQNLQSSLSLIDDDVDSIAQSGARQLDENSSEAAIRVPDWISRPKTSALSVVFNETSLRQLSEILEHNAEEKKSAVENVLKEDPRSVYLRQRYGNQFYTFLIHELHITCKFDDDKKTVTVFKVRHAGRMCDCGQPEWQCSGH